MADGDLGNVFPGVKGVFRRVKVLFPQFFIDLCLFTDACGAMQKREKCWLSLCTGWSEGRVFRLDFLHHFGLCEGG